VIIKLFGNILHLLEEKQQSTLTEWCCAQENSSNPESRRRRSVASVSEEYNLLDSSGDTVFNHLVSFFFVGRNVLGLCN